MYASVYMPSLEANCHFLIKNMGPYLMNVWSTITSDSSTARRPRLNHEIQNQDSLKNIYDKR